MTSSSIDIRFLLKLIHFKYDQIKLQFGALHKFIVKNYFYCFIAELPTSQKQTMFAFGHSLANVKIQQSQQCNYLVVNLRISIYHLNIKNGIY